MAENEEEKNIVFKQDGDDTYVANPKDIRNFYMFPFHVSIGFSEKNYSKLMSSSLLFGPYLDYDENTGTVKVSVKEISDDKVLKDADDIEEQCSVRVSSEDFVSWFMDASTWFQSDKNNPYQKVQEELVNKIRDYLSSHHLLVKSIDDISFINVEDCVGAGILYFDDTPSAFFYVNAVDIDNGYFGTSPEYFFGNSNDLFNDVPDSIHRHVVFQFGDVSIDCDLNRIIEEEDGHYKFDCKFLSLTSNPYPEFDTKDKEHILSIVKEKADMFEQKKEKEIDVLASTFDINDLF